MPQKPSTPKVPTRSNPPQKSYKHIAVIFVVIALILVLGVVYLALSKVTITLTPVNEMVTHEFKLTVSEDELFDETIPSIRGQVFFENLEENSTNQVSEGETVDGIATGTVTVFNERSEPQTLVRTTRLLTPRNVLFRLSKQITIPANSSVEVEVYADVAGASGNIEPTSFTIPGLSKTMQKFVYAKSNKTFTGGTKTVGVLRAADIEKAEVSLKDVIGIDYMPKEAEIEDDYVLVGSDVQVADMSYNAEVGDEVDSFELTANLSVTSVYANREEILNMAKEEIKRRKGLQGDSIDIDPSSLTYEFVSADKEEKTAVLKVSISGLINFDPSQNVFDKNMLVGFTEEDIKLYFSQFDSIKDINVEFSPFWVKKVPILKDHIEIKVVQ